MQKIPNAKPSNGCKAVDNNILTLVAELIPSDLNQQTSCDLDCAEGFYFAPATVGRALKCLAVDKTPNPNVEPTGMTNLDSISPPFTCQGL